MSEAPAISVYCIRDDHRARVKIGHSVSPCRRLRQLQTGSAGPLRLVATFESSRHAARFFHSIYQHRRLTVRGRKTEWFDDLDVVVSENFLEVASGWGPGSILASSRVVPR